MSDKSEPAGQADQPAPDAGVSGQTAPLRPAFGGGAASHMRPPRKPAPPSFLGLSPRKTLLLLGAVAVIAGAALVAAIIHSANQMTNSMSEGSPKLAAEFEDRANNYTIRPPVGWVIEDRHDGANIFIKGPREMGFPPLIIVSLEIKPGGMEAYLQEHKDRIAFKDKTVKWIGRQESDFIDGCPNTVRLEYECDDELDNGTTVRVHALQYIMEDKPRFYRVTCFVSPENYEKYLPKFEASARSFKRTPLPKATPQVLP